MRERRSNELNIVLSYINSSAAACCMVSVNPKEILDPLVGIVDFLSMLRTCQHNLTAGEDQ